MSRFLKVVGREFLMNAPVLRENFLDFEFARRVRSFRGIYESFADAMEHAPATKPVGYEWEDDTPTCEAVADQLNPSDYSVLYWLTRILPGARNVFDLGGNLGVAFYAYRHFLDFPADLTWTVCEIPSTVKAGQALAKKRGVAEQLVFTEDRAEAEGADLFFTAGALQYIEEPFAEILERLERKPKHVIVHRVPMQEGETFITLQNNGTWVAPYKVTDERELIANVTELGYELVNVWPTFRNLEVLSHPFNRKAVYKGMYFRSCGGQ